LIVPAVTALAVANYCDAGNSVAADFMEGVHHLEAAAVAAPDLKAWMDGLFAGERPATNCGDALPVEPIEPLGRARRAD
jgi:hypothetical protein